MMTRRRIFKLTVMLATLGAGLFLSDQQVQARCCRRSCGGGCGVSSCGGGGCFSSCRRSRCGRCGGGGWNNCGYGGGCATGGCAVGGGCATAPMTTNPDGTIAPTPQGGTTAPPPAPAPAPAPST